MVKPFTVEAMVSLLESMALCKKIVRSTLEACANVNARSTAAFRNLVCCVVPPVFKVWSLAIR